ncbi:hypothetical protein JOB18_033040 [Solea senegalensis]|uniref:Uncharacterized protein n=1 Tax=Solea senegalensis TaxID=28829 RepID=A0AAV6SMQ8_SOLSE|nr:hypothetical protein JOB18_033040 [Solea senegalensis]
MKSKTKGQLYGALGVFQRHGEGMARHGNSVAEKTSRKIEIGWLHFGAEKYQQNLQMSTRFKKQRVTSDIMTAEDPGKSRHLHSTPTHISQEQDTNSSEIVGYPQTEPRHIYYEDVSESDEADTIEWNPENDLGGADIADTVIITLNYVNNEGATQGKAARTASAKLTIMSLNRTDSMAGDVDQLADQMLADQMLAHLSLKHLRHTASTSSSSVGRGCGFGNVNIGIWCTFPLSP